MYKTKKQYRSEILEKQADTLLKSYNHSKMLSENIKRGLRIKKEREKLNKK